MIRVKVCGMMSRDDIETCVEAGVDAVGFIFAEGARRLSIDAAAELTRLVPPYVTSVGVFAQNDAMLMDEAVRRCRLDVLQCSIAASPELLGSFGRPTIVVVHANDDEPVLPDQHSLAAAQAIAIMVDAYVLGLAGGSGVRVPEDVAANLRRGCTLPFILAGGLTPGNVAGAVAAVQPWAVDVRSGVERGGKKDRLLVERFVREARDAERCVGRS